MNKTDIIAQMEAVARNGKLTGEYDVDINNIRVVAEEIPETDFPLLWQCSRLRSWLFPFRKKAREFQNQRWCYWYYLRTLEYPMSDFWTFGWSEDSKYFLITKMGLCELKSPEELERVVKEVFDPLIEDAKKANGGKLPPYQPARFITNLPDSAIEAINMDCHEHGDKSFERCVGEITRNRCFADHKFVGEWDTKQQCFWVREYDGNNRVNSDIFSLSFFGWPEDGVRNEKTTYGWAIENHTPYC